MLCQSHTFTHKVQLVNLVENQKIMNLFTHSCGGPNTEIKKDLKTFTVNSGIDLNVDPSTINFNSLEVEFNTY